MKNIKTMVLAVILSIAVLFGAGATGASATPITHTHVAVQPQAVQKAGTIVPANVSMDCWAQAGRVVGGFWGALISSAVTPWAAAAYWAAYLGAMAAENKTPAGDFACKG